jgi:hypothetical protein
VNAATGSWEASYAFGWPTGEAILFVVGQAYFVVPKDDFKLGRRSGDGDTLIFEAGRSRVIVVPQVGAAPSARGCG